ncbi:MAG: hypothetical protein LBC02_02025, partial [Planctomycetaceae bacterium]|nr:hypothetical protein [Planctomycetaceae bacterium]
MHIILFEDNLSPQLFPATIARPAFAINVGTYRLIHLVRRLSDNIEVIVRPYLKELVLSDYPWIWKAEKGNRSEPVLILNARVVPHVDLIEHFKRLISEGRSGVVSGPHGVACALFSHENPIPNEPIGASQLLGIIEDKKLPPLEIPIPMLEYAHDIVRHQIRVMNDNLNDRLRTREYKEIADGVFSADGRPLGQFCVTDSSEGPIILESDVNVG